MSEIKLNKNVSRFRPAEIGVKSIVDRNCVNIECVKKLDTEAG